MKTFKKILIIICVVIIAVGMIFLARQGLNYADGYNQNMLLETAKDYALYAGIATGVILVYLAIRYNKQGVMKVIATSILGIVGAIAIALSIIVIVKMPVTRILFSIMLAVYTASLIILSSYFEAKA